MRDHMEQDARTTTNGKPGCNENASGSPPAIEIRNLHKSFGDKRVLQGVNLTVYRGESFVLLGRSGGGKSVLLKHIVGLMKPDRGSVLIEGVELTTASRRMLTEIRSKVAFVFQGGALFDSMTVWENVGFFLLQHSRKSLDEIKALAVEKLKMVELEGVEDLMPAELSGGMRKRVAIARAIAFNPRIILYDEPTTGLDPVTADSVNKLMKRMKEMLGVTSVVVTHDLKSAYEVGDRIGIIENGVITFCDSKEHAPFSENPEMRRFFETSGVAFAPSGVDNDSRRMTGHDE